MPEVSFYLLSTQSQQDRYLFACKLIEKAFRCQQFCYVYADTQSQCQQLDNQLWSFRGGSFVPHQINDGSSPGFEQTTLIGTQPAPDKWQKLIINLSSNLPENFMHTERILEILDNNEANKQSGRQRFRQYKLAGLDITTHEI